MEYPSTFAGCRESDQDWYDLFSRGARDWLRHNEKVRKAVRDKLPEVLANADVFGGDRGRTVKVPVKFLEHFRFRLRESLFVVLLYLNNLIWININHVRII